MLVNQFAFFSPPKDSGSSSVSEEEEFEEEFDELDIGVPISTISFEPVPSAKDAAGEMSGPVASAPALNVIPATPSLDRIKDPLPDSTTPESPAVIPVSSATSPSGSISKEHPVSLVDVLVNPLAIQCWLFGPWLLIND